MIPSRGLWAGLCLLSLPAIAAGFVPGVWPVLLWLDAILVLLAVVDVLLARRVPLEVTRTRPDKLSVGAANKVTVQVRHRGRGT